jgi:hypothetical protein
MRRRRNITAESVTDEESELRDGSFSCLRNIGIMLLVAIVWLAINVAAPASTGGQNQSVATPNYTLTTSPSVTRSPSIAATASPTLKR